jgi:dihydropteroate synthase
MKAHRTWKFLDREFHFEKPMVMGILNVTPDSFSDGGTYSEVDSALNRAMAMVAQGATIIDIGGESTRPGSSTVSADEELSRVLPIISALRSQTDALISIDTRKANVAREAIAAGVAIVNDISAGNHDPDMLPLVANSGVGYIMMHMQGTPLSMQLNPRYEDLLSEVHEFFEVRIADAVQAGISKDQIILDPGIGFGKTLEHNLVLLSNMNALRCHDRPLLLGASRKSFIAMLDNSDVENRLGGSLAAVLSATQQGVEMYRVHDVAETVQAIHIFTAIQGHSD